MVGPGTLDADSIAVTTRRGQRGKKPVMKDFEEIFGKDIDQFLEDSDWDVNSAGQREEVS